MQLTAVQHNPDHFLHGLCKTISVLVLFLIVFVKILGDFVLISDNFVKQNVKLGLRLLLLLQSLLVERIGTREVFCWSLGLRFLCINLIKEFYHLCLNVQRFFILVYKVDHFCIHPVHGLKGLIALFYQLLELRHRSLRLLHFNLQICSLSGIFESLLNNCVNAST